jgi:electron transport complex protein RnfB
VDCIELTPLPVASYDKEQARARFNARAIRLLRESHDLQQAYRQKRHLSQQTADKAADKAAKQQYILQAMKRSLNKS